MTVQELVKAALRSIGAIATGETPTADELADGMEALNIMLRSWKGFAIHCFTEDSHTLTAGTGEYTIGTLGDINTARPSKIVRAFTTGTGIDSPVGIIGERKYREIATKTTTGVPAWLYYNPIWPLGKIFLFPVPSSALTLYLYSKKDLAQSGYSVITTSVSFPVEYDKAIKYNLAIELAPEYGKEPSGAVIKNAAEALTELRAVNASNMVQPVKLEMIDLSTRFNINAG